MSAAKHGSSTPDPTERLTSAERQHLFQIGLSKEVTAACDQWLFGRGLRAAHLSGEYPFEAMGPATSHPGAIAAPSCGDADPTPHPESPQPSKQTPDGVTEKHGREIEQKPAILKTITLNQ